MVARGPGDGPLFRFDDGKPITRLRFVARIKEILTTAGFDCTPYSGHNIWSLAATTAAAQGFSTATIKMLGRWKSCAYHLYIKTPRDQLAADSYNLGCALAPPPTVVNVSYQIIWLLWFICLWWLSFLSGHGHRVGRCWEDIDVDWVSLVVWAGFPP